MDDLIRCEYTMRSNRRALYGARTFLRGHSFCYLMMVGVVLCLLSGCTARLPKTVLITATEIQSTPASTLTLTATDVVSASVIIAAETKTSTPLPGEGTITYTVQNGDTLSELAQTYGTTITAIKAANELTGDQINDGQTLEIPYTRLPTHLSPNFITPTTTAISTAVTQPTTIYTPFPQLTPDSEGEEVALSDQRPRNWLTQNYTLLLGIPLILVIAVVVFMVIGRRPSAHVPSAPPPAAIAVTTGRSGLSTPPPLGTAYLETRLDQTGATLYYPLTQSVMSIGRDPGNTIAIDQRFADWDAVSSWHVQIVRTGDSFIAKDLGSANGMLINRRRSRENVLRDGTILGIGNTQFTFRRNQPGGIV